MRVAIFGIKLNCCEIYFVPGDCRIVLESGLAFLAEVVHWRINFFQLAARGIVNDLWPSFIGFAESNCVGMARSAVSPEGFVGFFRNVRATHHDRHAHGANGVGHAIRLGDHASHRADADKPDVLFAHVSGDPCFIHGLRVAIDQNDFMAGRSQRLEQKHPEVRHEITRDPVVRVVEQNAHAFSP